MNLKAELKNLFKCCLPDSWKVPLIIHQKYIWLHWQMRVCACAYMCVYLRLGFALAGNLFYPYHPRFLRTMTQQEACCLWLFSSLGWSSKWLKSQPMREPLDSGLKHKLCPRKCKRTIPLERSASQPEEGCTLQALLTVPSQSRLRPQVLPSSENISKPLSYVFTVLFFGGHNHWFCHSVLCLECHIFWEVSQFLDVALRTFQGSSLFSTHPHCQCSQQQCG